MVMVAINYKTEKPILEKLKQSGISINYRGKEMSWDDTGNWVVNKQHNLEIIYVGESFELAFIELTKSGLIINGR
jgi:hypothetical protein